MACPSGLRSTPRKRVRGQLLRGFKSHRHRQLGAASRRTVLWCGGERDQQYGRRPIEDPVGRRLASGRRRGRDRCGPGCLPARRRARPRRRRAVRAPDDRRWTAGPGRLPAHRRRDGRVWARHPVRGCRPGAVGQLRRPRRDPRRGRLVDSLAGGPPRSSDRHLAGHRWRGGDHRPHSRDRASALRLRLDAGSAARCRVRTHRRGGGLLHTAARAAEGPSSELTRVRVGSQRCTHRRARGAAQHERLARPRRHRSGGDCRVRAAGGGGPGGLWSARPAYCCFGGSRCPRPVCTRSAS